MRRPGRTPLLVALTGALLLVYVLSLLNEASSRSRLASSLYDRRGSAPSDTFGGETENENERERRRGKRKQSTTMQEVDANDDDDDDDEVEGPARKVIKSDEETRRESEFVESPEMRKEAEAEIVIDEEEEEENDASLTQDVSPWSKPIEILPSRRSNITKNLKLNVTNPDIRKTFDGGIHLITTFYKGSYAQQRFKELIIVMRRNLKNPYLTALHALWEDVDPISYVPEPALHSKLVRARFGRQPAYKDMFDYANKFLRRGSVAIISNSDIHFDETLKCVKNVPKDRKIFNNTFNHLAYALSRHPAPPCDKGRHDMCSSYIGSHDAFLFAPPVPAKFAAKLDFTQNHISAENVVIWEFRNMKGYQVRNPCHVINALHLHCTNERHYRTASISHGRYRIGNIDRHASIMPSNTPKCGQFLF